jgi:hypothetical protein
VWRSFRHKVNSLRSLGQRVVVAALDQASHSRVSHVWASQDTKKSLFAAPERFAALGFQGF